MPPDQGSRVRRPSGKNSAAASPQPSGLLQTEASYLRLRQFTPINVNAAADETYKAAPSIQGHPAIQEPIIAAVVTSQPELYLGWCTRLEGSVEVLCRSLRVVRVKKLQPPKSSLLIQAAPCKFKPSLVHPVAPEISTDPPEHDGCFIRHLPERLPVKVMIDGQLILPGTQTVARHYQLARRSHATCCTLERKFRPARDRDTDQP